MTHFTNNGQGKRRVAFGAPFPGSIIPVDMATTGEELTCQKDSFLCAALGTELTIAFRKKLGAGFLAVRDLSCNACAVTAWHSSTPAVR